MCKFFRTGHLTFQECPSGMSRFVLTESDHLYHDIPGLVLDTKTGKLKHRKNRTNDRDAKSLAEGSAEFVAFVLYHFAPVAFRQMSEHIKNAPDCQLGKLQARTNNEGVPFTGIAMNADLTCKLICK